MKKSWALGIGAGILAAGSAAATAAVLKKKREQTPLKKAESIKILTIGNSFSDDTMKYVYNIAYEAGIKDIVLGNLYIAGCSLERHLKNAEEDLAEYDYRVNRDGTWVTTPETKLCTAISSEQWDVISLQQQSGKSGVPETYQPLYALIDYVKGLCPGATLVWNMTWAFAQDSTHREFVNYDNDQMTMYNAIVSTVKKIIVRNKAIKAVVPVGTAIQNARTSKLGDTLNRDGFHLSYDLGRFTAGLTFVKALTGKDISGITFRPDGVDEEQAAIVIKAAENAVKRPFKVTPFKPCEEEKAEEAEAEATPETAEAAAAPETAEAPAESTEQTSEN